MIFVSTKSMTKQCNSKVDLSKHSLKNYIKCNLKFFFYNFSHKVSYWIEEGKISLLHVGFVGKLESIHRGKVINQKKGKLQSASLEFGVVWVLHLEVYLR